MSTLIKICGLKAPEAVDAAMAAGADMVGFVVFEKSPRHISLQQGQELGARVGPGVAKVLLTVDADDALLAAAIAALGPAYLQLHGKETPERVAAIRANFGLKVIKAIEIENRAGLDRIRIFDEVADMLLFDAKAPANAAHPGGNGAPFDWKLLAGQKISRPWLLAGGLHSGNVAEALRASGAHGVDVSSGVESAPGVKDADKIAAFIQAARAEAPGVAPTAKSAPRGKAGLQEKLGLARRNG
ncbi:Phosphoribosylanthranilate isomerase [Methylocella silvestris BL2]|uniref:N-(5'-phosphoribosyl)anthranilate isomerase n=1 Tax=Methylocella silvestris (strain DSM 15510 / CIP 108128 / LMG 27833 / NCIMB 13906 / BL2) TaxID=395965 RepID=B8EMZ2_METSB|nr:phosphoribosylanthranilate isomerase [Methylocella silvestris]ACK49127.1 Phosphoribosylanthranilate isomerase [Methylocella silvestris BL2]